MDSWVKPYRYGQFIVMFSKAPFYFSKFLPTLRWGSLSWRRYEFKVIRIRVGNSQVRGDHG